ncbi:LCP family protein [Actinomadura hibisca]|uniref:LCP family protein n=1 Tax=Actinomadura hibisca TaxID=68565 RepID=UPI000832E52A|nr:LCP family protein [Actinomadura hibisca]
MSDNDPRREDLAGDDNAATNAPGVPDPAAPTKSDAGNGRPSADEKANQADAPSQDAETATPGTGEGEASGTDGVGTPGTGEGESVPPGRKRSRRRKILRRTALGTALLLLAAGGGAGWLYYDLRSGIEQKSVASALGTDRPKKLNKSLNILLLGSDTRDGDNARYGAAAGMTGARSDTAILLHLSPNRDQAVGISFPRDSMVRIPDCKKEKGGTVPGQFGMLNAAFAFAGPTCTWKTLETLTGIHIDHFVQIDFTGFKRMVDALDGVEICVDKPVSDPRAELFLKAGKQTVKGEQALGYVRARYSLGDGGDLGRIERQQKFMASVVAKATSGEVLSDPAKTYKFLKAATKSVTTDDELDLAAMRKLAEGVKDMSAGQVRFVTVPVEEYAPDHNRVQWNDELARPLFEAVKHDNDLPAPQPAKAGPRPPAPKDIKVTVVDAGGKDELVERIAHQLRQRGFDVTREKAADGADSRIVHAPSAEAKAAVLAQTVPNALLTPDTAAPGDRVKLVIGTKGVRLAPPPLKIKGGVKPGQNLCR